MEQTQEDLTFYFEERERRKKAFKTFFRKLLNFFHNYLSSLVVIPATLGGIWQALELISIKLPLIRFFSVSQIIADGILVVIFSFVVIMGIIFLAGLYIIDPPKKPYKTIKIGEEISVLLGDVLTFTFCFGAFYLLTIYAGRNLDDNNTSQNLWMLFLAIVGFLILSFVIFIRYASLKFEEPREGGYGHYMLSYPVLGFWLFFLGKVFIMFHVILLVPRDLINTQQIDCKVDKLYPNKIHKLQYFNDKYVFIEVYDTIQGRKSKDSVATKVLILNFDELLEEDNCKKDSVPKYSQKIKY
ncbi:hypothetical protein HKT18_09110 [Flavobacterium sp. IMCC34852]|uniref:Uncharacterized protein n=1 Tax=Flavobacterium rivulicola TaxID=2732161 RepID=A0A7Y3R9M4_9FLAO|nr:hypothetical protein [Flavobacterium sp. IMCC34852]NNT72371.1 hypothetical protein [Flavobacterium sp. IMCC34852]